MNICKLHKIVFIDDYCPVCNAERKEENLKYEIEKLEDELNEKDNNIDTLFQCIKTLQNKYNDYSIIKKEGGVSWA